MDDIFRQIHSQWINRGLQIVHFWSLALRGSDAFNCRGNLSTYKELCSLASDLNRPDLVYKFMHLANHHSLWNSKKVGGATGHVRSHEVTCDATTNYVIVICSYDVISDICIHTPHAPYTPPTNTTHAHLTQGAAFGFSTIASQAQEQLAPYLPTLVPRLYRYKYDPSPRIQLAMSSIWSALVPESKKAVSLCRNFRTGELPW